MKLAKPHLDLGLFTRRIGRQREFWGGTVGLRLDHELTLKSGWVQHRFDAHGSVIKVNHWADELPALPPSGYVGLSIVREGAARITVSERSGVWLPGSDIESLPGEAKRGADAGHHGASRTRLLSQDTVSAPPWEGRDADGNAVRLVAPGTDGLTRIGVTVRTPDPPRMVAFYVDAMEFERVDERTARCGDSLLFVEHGAGGSETEDFIGPGYRYLTVQVFDADIAMGEIIARGGRLAREAVSLGKVARFGFVKDPDGNWIEISARTSLTGSAPKQD